MALSIWYELYLINNDDYKDINNIISSLMLLYFDIKEARHCVESAFSFGKTVIFSSENRSDILLFEKIFKEEGLNVLIEKYEGKRN